MRKILTIFFILFLSFSCLDLLTYLPNKDQKTQIKVREGFFIVALFWFILSFFGSLPFFMDESLNLSFVDAVFESTSGWTTTGATIITNLDDLNKPLLLYRQLLQWLGGIGIVVSGSSNTCQFLVLEVCTYIKQSHLHL